MKKVMMTILISFGVLGLLGAIGYYAIGSLGTSPEKEISAAAGKAEKELNEASAPAGSEQKTEVGLEELQFQIKLHQMTHQKITASKKRGAIEMTPETIDDMLKIAHANEGSYAHYDFYIEALEEWEKGEFTNAVDVHNTIWTWQGGTVGKATGLMTEEQEAEYVENHFR